ncbi:hypothetical protein L218DRAFT_955489 [Marasmius fiardii PR-910]|nr:hypothetical protein L218DRAFT_955489 [Marasmius fiardii PR-910]
MATTGRRSARIQEKRNKSDKSSTQNVYDDSNEEIQVKPARKAKKARTAMTSTNRNQSNMNANPLVFRRTRGRRGLLEKLAREAPLDILLEIYIYLEPQDILNLSRTSKELREYLLKHSSSPIWRKARENCSDLPPLPCDLNEPQYASLLFDNFCYSCLRSPCDNIIWECRVRCHKGCMNELFLAQDEYEDLHQDVDLSDICTVTRVTPCYNGTLQKGYYDDYWPVPIVERLLSQYKEIRSDKSAVKDWTSQRRQDLESIREHAEQCRIWEKNRRGKHQTEQQTLRNKRRKEIIKRLSALGWGPKELKHREFLSHPLVKQSKPVTERVWNNLEPQLVECLQALKEKRLGIECRGSLLSRYGLLKNAYDEKTGGDVLGVYPPIAEFILNGADYKVIDDMIWKTPHRQRLVKSQFISALQEFDIVGFTQKWVQEKSQELEKLLRNKELDTYQLRSTIFTCESCEKKTWVPRIYTHQCQHPLPDHPTGWNKPGFDPFRELGWHQWRGDGFSLDVQRTKRVNEVMSLCGLESVEELDQADPVLECVPIVAETPRGAKYCMRWTEAIMGRCKLIREIRDRKIESLVSENEGHHPICCEDTVCKECPTGGLEVELPDLDIRTHLYAKHGIHPDNAEKNVHWCYRLQTDVFSPSIRIPAVYVWEKS